MIRLDEASTAVIDILERHKCVEKGWVMKKSILFDEVEAQAIRNRKKDDKGFTFIPTVNNKVVPPPNAAFCRGNWKDIKIFAAECGYYIVGNVPGDPLGIRLGTIEEFTCCQGFYIAISEGMADAHNERASTIEEQGIEQPEMVVRIRRYREEKEGES
jgi:hypothetical protein